MTRLALNTLREARHHANGTVRNSLHTYQVQANRVVEQVWNKTNQIHSHNLVLQNRIKALEDAEILRNRLDELTGKRLDQIERSVKVLEKQPAPGSSSGAKHQALVTQIDQLEQLVQQLQGSGATTGTTTNTFVVPQKPTEPLKFSGPKDNIPAKEWIQKMGMYFGDAKITTDEDKVRQALLRLTGEAYQYMSPVVDKIAAGMPSGHTWVSFAEVINKVYGKKTDKEIAEKEIEGYYGDKGKKKVKDDFFNWAQKFRTLGRLAEIDGSTVLTQLKKVMPEKVRDTFATMESVPGFNMPTDWEVYLDTALDMYKRLYPDKLKGKIFAEEKRKESAAPAKASESKDSSKSKTSDKGKGSDKPSGTSNGQSDCKKHPGEHKWKDCPDNWNNKKKSPESKSSSSGKTKPTGSSSGSSSGTKKLDPKKKYKVRVVTSQELVTDNEDESPKATVGTLSADIPHILERVVPLAPTTRISEEAQSGESPMAIRTNSIQTTRAGPETSAPPSGDALRVRLPWLQQRIADSATALGIHSGTPKDFLTERM
ncbi:hypothetical protein WOLCODRAFT_152662 [Wolfiporia cocos MD-104 SS10]|uniref:Retrotransposon gag domain-containing protein n=1 Tax=Wolfiporia cocos (strain MD-104) TaxID=742152 RepID=A0A2H3JL79_WOLCO|nr:hypothetical protein WOLCODRAFT_152662 [Wolfiporia cocos MD-104 SS10]